MKKLTLTISDSVSLVPIAIEDYETLQNMARFYVYDLSRYCASIGDNWYCPSDGLYECIDFISYIEMEERYPYFIKVDGVLAGFVLLKKIGLFPETDWNMGEFFVLAQFQGKGIAYIVAEYLSSTFSANWEVSVIPENIHGLKFWRKVIDQYMHGHYVESIETIHFDPQQPNRYVFQFNSADRVKNKEKIENIRIRPINQRDIHRIVQISREKREAYAKAEPVFWKVARDADMRQAEYFYDLLSTKKGAGFLAEAAGDIQGFLIGQIIDAPAVYDPGGKTLWIDDFCVIYPNLWDSVGTELLAMVKKHAQTCSQYLIVCGMHDNQKKKWLSEQGLTLISGWYRGSIFS